MHVLFTSSEILSGFTSKKDTTFSHTPQATRHQGPARYKYYFLGNNSLLLQKREIIMLNRLTLIFAVSSKLFAYNSVMGYNRVMVWMCLEFCDETSEQIQDNLMNVLSHRDIVDSVSFEKYTLGPNSTLVDNNLTSVSWKLNAAGIDTIPLLSSFPHPPEFIQWMRQVFQNPEPFIDSCIHESRKYNYNGWNLDWEPTDDVTEEDGIQYADFIDSFCTSMHKEKLYCSVDIATWSPIWNYTAISLTSVDTAISMGTYAASQDTFSDQLSRLLSAFDPSRSGVGLENDVNITVSDLSQRLQDIVAVGAAEVDVWKVPLPDSWWELIKRSKT